MKIPKLNKIEQLANNHWKYMEKVLTVTDPTLKTINIRYFNMMQVLYTQAMIHGIKHGAELNGKA
jgi:hypothetical protein